MTILLTAAMRSAFVPPASLEDSAGFLGLHAASEHTENKIIDFNFMIGLVVDYQRNLTSHHGFMIKLL